MIRTQWMLHPHSLDVEQMFEKRSSILSFHYRLDRGSSVLHMPVLTEKKKLTMREG